MKENGSMRRTPAHCPRRRAHIQKTDCGRMPLSVATKLQLQSKMIVLDGKSIWSFERLPWIGRLAWEEKER